MEGPKPNPDAITVEEKYATDHKEISNNIKRFCEASQKRML